MATMRAVVCRSYGPPDVLRVEDRPVPTAGPHDVLVRVHAASLNSWDWELLQGTPLSSRIPHFRRPQYAVLGTDIAGTVEAVGSEVTRLQVGDRVLGDLSGCGWGALAEYARAAEDAVVPIPDGITDEAAAAAPQAGLLALNGIRYKGGVSPGQRVLVNGAGGGVGTFAVQMAKARGAEVTGVDVADKLDVVRGAGADRTIDFRSGDYTRTGPYERIVDTSAKRSMLEVRRALAPAGVYVAIGGRTSRILQLGLVGAWTALTGRRRMGLLIYMKPRHPDLVDLAGLLASGDIAPVIDRTVPLADTADAFRRFAANEVRGKIVITCR